MPDAFFASAAKGTEGLLRDELRELGVPGVRADRGGVHFSGGRSAAFRVLLGSRIALRVLEPVARFAAEHERALYDGVRSFDAARVLTPRLSLAVSAACRSSHLTHTQYVSQLVKDALVDRQRDESGARSNVDKDDPDVRFFLHLVKDEATLYLDWAGESLHLRGWRTARFEAPLRENLAAALLRAAGFRGDGQLVDPTCGSGTLLIEGALIAMRSAPGLARARFGAERWADFDRAAARELADLRGELHARLRPAAVTPIGLDLSPEALTAARDNARRAGVELRLSRGNLTALEPPIERGVLVSNPPYGERLARGAELGTELAALMERFSSWQRGVIVPEGTRFGRRRPTSLLRVFNGDLPCELQCWAAAS